MRNRYLFLLRSHATDAGIKDLTDPDFQQSLRIAVIKLPLKINTRDRNAVFAFYARQLAERLKMMGYTFTKKPPSG